IDYPADGGDDGDDEMDIKEDEDDDMDIDADEEYEDDEMDVEVDEEAEEEHPTPAYPVVVALPAIAPSAEETEPFETDECAATPPPICLRWVPTGKIFTSSTTKVDSEPPNGSKEDITNQCESEQALDVSA
ncbi:hypothetical protein Tco_0259097, partial [Tanacetum coccineum]